MTVPRMAGDNQSSVADELFKLASLWEGGAITEAEYRVLREKVAPVLEGAPGSESGWYLDPLGRFDYRWWDGTRWTRHVSWRGSVREDPGSIGGRWYDVPGEPGVRRYWNGRHWTNRYRRNAPRSWLAALTALAFIGIAVLSWGTDALFRWTPPPGVDVCTDDSALGGLMGVVLVPWLVLVALFGAGLAICLIKGPQDPRMKTMVALGALSVVATVPLIAPLLVAFDCGM